MWGDGASSWVTIRRAMAGRTEQTRSQRRKARTELAILEAAERQFLERGFQEAKVDEIAEAADVAVGSLYNHFGSKEGLQRALVERALELHEAYMEGSFDPAERPIDQLVGAAESYARFALEHPGLFRMIAFPESAGAESAAGEGAARVGERLADQERRTATVIAQAVRRGDARPIDAERAARFFWSSWNGVLAPARHREAARADVAVEIEAALQMLIGGLASDQARKRDETVREVLRGAPGPAADRAGGRELELAREPVAADIRAEFPELALWTTLLAARPGPTPRPVKDRLAALSNRFSGSTALNLRRAPVPWAYRVFFRQLGIDPDERRTPVEEVALQRLRTGGFQSRNLLDDALLIAVVETGVPVLALDADRLHGGLEIRFARADERLGGDGPPLASGQVLIADQARAVGVLFGDTAEGRGVTEATRRILLAAIQVKGVPNMSVEEALWTAVEVLASAQTQ